MRREGVRPLGAPPENLVPGSLVFTMTAGPVDLRHLNQWWTWTPGACWRRPEGDQTAIEGREEHPVVHVAQPGQRLANYWHGDFPWRAEPGYGGTTPVGSFPENGYGLHDMAGNVWEWTVDWYADVHPEGADKPCCVPLNPRGGSLDGSYDPAQPQFRIPRRVIKGGSFGCADSYCLLYRPAVRRPQMIDTGMSHIGFRCISRGPAA